MSTREKFEDRFLEEIDTSLSIRQAYKEALRVLSGRGIPEMERFTDIYPEDEIERDRGEVDRLERIYLAERDLGDEYQEQRRRLASIFEAVFYEEAELNDWLGPRAYTIKASRFDDIKNGVDAVAELLEERADPSRLALAIDVTTGQDLGQKFERIRSEIELGNLAAVKYFESENTGYHGPLKNLPRVVIGADSETVGQLAELWLKKKNSVLAKHSVQFQILQEIFVQLRAFEKYADQRGQPKLARTYRETLAAIEQVHSDKLASLEDTGRRDTVFESIKIQAERLAAAG